MNNLPTKVLYLSYDGMTDPLGQSQILPYIIGLSKQGFDFTLISAEKSIPYQEGRAFIENLCKENNIDWQPVPYTKSPPVLSTMKDLRTMKRKAILLHKKKNFSLLHCRGYITAIIGQYMKKKYKTGFLFDMRGLWANEKVDAGAWRLNNPVYRAVFNYYKNKERQFFLQADYSVSLTEAGKKEILSWPYMVDKNIPIKLIPCATDGNHLDPEKIDAQKRLSLLKELGIAPGTVILSYLGSIGTWYMLDEMLDFFKRFILQAHGAKMLFITGMEHDLINKRCHEKGIDPQKIIIRKANRQEVPLYISLSDYSIFFIRASYSKISSSPTKQGELMAMGIPVICNSGVGDTDTIVRKYDSGVIVNQYDDAEYDRKINELLTTKFDKDKIRDGALTFFSLDEAVANYKSIYDYILNK